MRVMVVVPAVLLLSVLSASAQFVGPGGAVPVVANQPGLNATYWRSDVSILNTDDQDTEVVLMLFPEIVGGQASFELQVIDGVDIAAGEQLRLSNIVQSEFGLLNTKGALSVYSTTGAGLVIGSRVYTVGDQNCEGSYGQDVNSVLVKDSAWAVGVQHDGFYRSNLGIFLPIDPLPGETLSFEVEIFESDGETAGSGTVDFPEAGLQQINFGNFGVEDLFAGFVKISCSDPDLGWYAYVSTVDETSGDAVFRIARGVQPN